MALSKENIINGLFVLFTDMRDNNNPENSVETLANRLGTLIYDFVKTAEVQAGQSVSTTGTPTAQTGQTTTNGTII